MSINSICIKELQASLQVETKNKTLPLLTAVTNVGAEIARLSCTYSGDIAFIPSRSLVVFAVALHVELMVVTGLAMTIPVKHAFEPGRKPTALLRPFCIP